MNIASFLLLSATLGLATCGQSRKIPHTPAAAGVPESAAAPQVTGIVMSRGACFGKCPQYSVELMADGLVRYTGRSFVPYQGVYEKMLDRTAVNQVLGEFTAARTDTMQDGYKALVTDLPSLSYVIRFGDGTTKNIDNAGYGPAVLPNLSDAIDRLISVDYSWKKVGPVPKE